MMSNRLFQRRDLLTLHILLILLLTGPAHAQKGSVKPGINDKFLAKDLQVDTWTERFEGESRQIYAHRKT